MVEDLLAHEIALKEGTDLVFPSQLTRDNPDLPNPEGKSAEMRFEGPVPNIYATLMVRLARSSVFTLHPEDMWRNAAVYRGPKGGRYGLALGGDIEAGAGMLSLFADEPDPDILAVFRDFVHAHLVRRSVTGSVSTRLIVTCPDCRLPVSDEAVRRLRELGRPAVRCQVCDSTIPLVAAADASPRPEVRKMEATADVQRDMATATITIKAKRDQGDYDVFLCHNSEDKPTVVDIAHNLTQNGILPWLDIWEIVPGRSWQETLEEQIQNIKSAVVFAGPTGTGPWQRKEIRAILSEFVDTGRYVIPVILDGVEGEPDLPLFLRESHTIDARRPDIDVVEHLQWGITGKRPF